MDWEKKYMNLLNEYHGWLVRIREKYLKDMIELGYDTGELIGVPDSVQEAIEKLLENKYK